MQHTLKHFGRIGCPETGWKPILHCSLERRAIFQDRPDDAPTPPRSPHSAFFARRRRGALAAASTESRRPGKRSFSSARRREFVQTTPCGSIRMMPASRSTLKWREAVDLLRSRGISQQFNPSVSAIARTIFSRVGSLRAKRTQERLI
jgi:hypothetical protein